MQDSIGNLSMCARRIPVPNQHAKGLECSIGNGCFLRNISSHFYSPFVFRSMDKVLNIITKKASVLKHIRMCAQRLALPAAGENQLAKRETAKVQNISKKRGESQPSGARFVRLRSGNQHYRLAFRPECLRPYLSLLWRL